MKVLIDIDCKRVGEGIASLSFLDSRNGNNHVDFKHQAYYGYV